MKMSKLERVLIKKVKKEIESIEEEISEIYNKSSLEKPIQNDVVISKRNMGYNKIRELVEKYEKQKQKEKEEMEE